MSYPPNTGEPIRPAWRPLNKWWPIGFAIASVLLYAVGGGLYGSSCAITDGYYYYCSYGRWSGGIALLSLGGITSTVAFILLIIYLARRRSPTPYNPGTRLIDQSQFAQPAPSANVQAPAATYPQYTASKPVAEIRELPVNGAKFCGRCGATVQSAFCPKCGAPA